MYCKNCGRAVDDNSLYCYNCGVRLDNTSSENISEDNSSFGFAVFFFFFPIAGFILFLIYIRIDTIWTIQITDNTL